MVPSRRLARFLLILGAFVALPTSYGVAQERCDQAFFTEQEIAMLALQRDFEVRFSQQKVANLRMSEGRTIHSQLIPPREGMPVFLFMPGSNRGLTVDHPALLTVSGLGYGVATFNFSTQPMSVSALPKGERPHFRDQRLSIEDFARETEFVADRLRAAGHQEIIPVSLSYSGAASPFLKGFHRVIDTVPMTSSAATDPVSDFGRRMFRATMPGPFGQAFARGILLSKYRDHWQDQVKGILKQFPELDATRADDMVQGYARMSEASEGTSWKNVNAASVSHHTYMFAMGEGPVLLRDQLSTFRRLLTEREDALLYLVGEAGHLIPSDQPHAYAVILHAVAQGTAGLKSGIIMVDPKEGKVTPLEKADALKFIDEVLPQLPTNESVVADQQMGLLKGAMQKLGINSGESGPLPGLGAGQ